LAPNRRDLLGGCRKWLPAIRADRPLSVFIDQKHTLLLPSVPHWRRTVFRAADASVNAGEVRLGSKPPCLSPSNSRAVISFHFRIGLQAGEVV